MPKLIIPNSASLHTARAFLSSIDPFKGKSKVAILELNPKWAHVDPMAMVMIASWGLWCRHNGATVQVENMSRHSRYLARMKIFEHLGIPYEPEIVEHEEAGRFLPVTQVKSKQQISAVIGDVSAMLHLSDDPESLAAVQYCVSELIRNVLEHSNSPDGALVCAQRYIDSTIHRVTIAVADCGQGISSHLGQVLPAVLHDNKQAISLAMQPGITGARAGLYGTPDNAGAGLFITRCIAKGTGGYFFILSGNAAYRSKRTNQEDRQLRLFINPFEDPISNIWALPHPWQGTVVSVEIRTEKINNYNGFFQWIFRQIPKKSTSERRIIFT